MRPTLGEMIRQNWEEYVWPVIIGLVILRLLIKKSTRKITAKVISGIILGIVVILLALAVIGIAEFCLFGADRWMVIYPFTIIELPLVPAVIWTLRNLAEKILLHKNGCRTVGTVIEIHGGRSAHYKIRYYANEQEYICLANKLSQTDKWKCGSDVTVLYQGSAPQRACLAKEDLISALLLAAAYVLLMTGAVIAEYVVMQAL